MLRDAMAVRESAAAGEMPIAAVPVYQNAFCVHESASSALAFPLLLCPERTQPSEA